MHASYKPRAIQLRKEGKTYREILSEIPIAKSTLSDWLRSVKLANPQQQRITQLRLDAAVRGAHARRDKRLEEIKNLNEQGKKDVGKISERELWLIGTALHWAEGSKQRESTPSAGIIFTNSDPYMCAVFLRWLRVLEVPDTSLAFELYVHNNREDEVETFKRWWAKQLAIPIKKIGAVYFKREKVLTNRTNITDLYHGLIRIRVRSSTSLNRRINGWIEGIVHQ